MSKFSEIIKKISKDLQNYAKPTQKPNLYQEAISNNKTSYDNSLNNYLKEYNTAKDDLEQCKKNELLSASIEKQRLEKYLPQQLKNQGLDGLGVAQSDLLQINNNYGSKVNDINKNYNDSSIELLRNYMNMQESAKNNYEDKDFALKNYMYQDEQQKQNNAYTDIDSVISAGEFNSAEELKTYYDTVKNSLNDSQKKQIEQRINYLINSPEEAERQRILQEEAQQAQEDRDYNTVKTYDNIRVKNDWDISFKPGDDFDVQINDSGYYRVQSGGQVTDENIVKQARNLSDGTLFTIANNIFVKHNGNVYLVTARNTKQDHYDKLYKTLLAL